MSNELSATDANFLALDSPTTHQAIAALSILHSAPDVPRVLRDTETVVSHYPRMRERLSSAARPYWVSDPDFCISRHVEVVQSSFESEEELLRSVASEFEKGVDLERPLWRLVVFIGDSQHHASLFVVHHSFVDGIAGLELFASFCGRSADIPASPSKKRKSKLTADPTTKPSSSVKKSASNFQSFLKLLRDGLGGTAKSLVNGANSSQRSVAILDVAIEPLQQLRRAYDSTLNDIFLTIVSGTLRQYHLRKNYLPSPLRVIMPVNTRALGERGTLGNMITGVGVNIPVHIDSFQGQLDFVKRQVDQLKNRAAFGAYGVLARINARVPSFLRRILSDFAATRTHCICTSVPGPKIIRYFGGSEIVSQYGLAALMKGHGIAFAFLRYQGKCCISLVGDPAIVANIAEMKLCLENTVNNLLEIAEGHSSARRDS